MNLEDTTSQPGIIADSGYEQNHGSEWPTLYRRLEVSQSAIYRKLNPTPEDEQKILRARARQLAVRIEEPESCTQLLDIVEFVLGTEHYGIETLFIREIHALTDFTPLPCTPAFVLGLVNVRGQIRSIVDIKKLFDLPDKGLSDLNKILIVQDKQMEVGILADAILGIRSISLKDLRPSLPTLTGMRAEYLKGITKDSLVVLDMEAILWDEKFLVDESVDSAD